MKKEVYMYNLLVYLYISILICVLSIPAQAQDKHSFQDTKEEMVRALTQEPVKHRGYKPESETRTISVVKKDQGKMVQHTVTVQDSASKARLKIEFDYDSYALRPESYPLLQELGRALNSPELRQKDLILEGHTDSDGPADYNRNLSLKRASAVKDYLVGNLDIDPDRLKVRGCGEELPLKPNDSPAHKQMNRRVEVRVIR